MNILAIKADGDFCPVESYRNGGPWVPSDETDISKTFAREVAKLRGESKPFIADDYADVERHHHMMFADGFER